MICCKRKIKGHLCQGIEAWDFRMEEGGGDKMPEPSSLSSESIFEVSLWWRMVSESFFSNFWHRMSKSRKTSWGYCMATKTGGFDWAWEKERTKAASVSKCCCFPNSLRSGIPTKQKHNEETSECTEPGLIYPYKTGQSSPTPQY